MIVNITLSEALHGKIKYIDTFIFKNSKKAQVYSIDPLSDLKLADNLKHFYIMDL